MGAGQSSLPTGLSHEKLFELTKDTRYVMNVLLEYMLKEVTVRDFLALSNPAECKKYVLFKANTLYKYFYELKIMPVRDKSDKRGMIAFRPVKELVAPQTQEAESERQSLCLILAYYYTRIFQIYGALALTLIDDMEIATRTGFMGMFGDDRQRLLAPGQRRYRTFGGIPTTGGAITYGQLQLFYFLRPFLLDQEDRQKGFRTIYTGEGTSKAEVYFKRPLVGTLDEQNRRYIEVESEKPQKGFFTIGYYGATKYSILEVFAKKEGIGSNNIKFEFGKISYTKKGSSYSSTSDIPTEILPKRQLTIIPEIAIGARTTTYIIKDPHMEVAEYFIDFFNKLIPFIRDLTEGDESVVTRYNVNGTRTPSETGVTEELKLSRTIQNLTKTKPYGHCIARALQLLRSAPFKDEPGLSAICKAKFIESIQTDASGTKTIVSRSGIPLPGSSLDTSPGMAALSQLFYDTIQQASVKIGTQKGPDGKSSLDQYITFMSNMARLFGDDQNRTTDSYMKSGLKGIINKRDKQLCTTSTGIITEDVIVPPKATNTVYNYVKELFKIQYEHASKCGAIFKQLFNIKQEKGSNRFEIALNDNVLQKGFPEIERINSVARNLLIDYYSKCETTYVKGMGVVLSSRPKPTTTTISPSIVSRPVTPRL